MEAGSHEPMPVAPSDEEPQHASDQCHAEGQVSCARSVHQPATGRASSARDVCETFARPRNVRIQAK